MNIYMYIYKIDKYIHMYTYIYIYIYNKIHAFCIKDSHRFTDFIASPETSVRVCFWG